MNLLSGIAVGVLLFLGAAVAVMNGVAAFVSLRNRRLGIDQHVSPVPLIAQLLILLAALFSNVFHVTWAPSWLFWGVALMDVSLWSLAAYPFLILWQSLRRLTRGRA